MSGRGAIPLSDYKDRKVSIICEECEILRHLSGKELYERHGDVAMPSLLKDLSKMVGCARPKSGYSKLCRLTHYRPLKEWISDLGYVSREQHEIALGKRLRDLHEWEVLQAVCQCGRRVKLNSKALTRQAGPDARIKELASKLHCIECKRYASIIEISSLPR